MELVKNTACLLCKEQTTVLKLENVKSYLDKLFDTFFDKSNIFKDEFQGMVADASLCLMCTPKVNICCNLRNDYEDKYNGKCLQKLFTSSGCLMCDGNSTPLTKTQDMPKSLMAQIELFMISTSFPESYSNSALCLTCIHSLNIWHEVRENIMKLTQNEVGENDCTNDNVDSDETDISTSALSGQINSKKTTIDENNKEKVSVIDIADSDAEVQNEGSTLDQADNDGSNEKIDDIRSKVNLSDSSKSESPILNNKFDRKLKKHKTIKKLSLTKHVMDKENLISDSSDSEIDGLNKIVEEIVESYENEEASAQTKSPNLNSSKSNDLDNERNITKIDGSSDSDNQLNNSQKLSSQSSNFSPCSSTSAKWYSKRTTFSAIVNDDTSDSESIKDNKNLRKKKRKRRATPSQSDNDDETKVDGSSDEESTRKRKSQLKFQLRRTKGSPEPEGQKLKRSNNEDPEKATKIDDSSDEELTQKNTQKFKHRGLLGFVKQSSEPGSLKNKKSDQDKQVTKISDSSDEESMSEGSKPKIVLKLKTPQEKKSSDEQTHSENSSDSDAKSASPEMETTIIDDSSDNESNHEQRSQRKRKSRKLKTRRTRKSENDKQRTAHSSSDSSDSETAAVESTQKLKKIDSKTKNSNELEATKIDNSSDSGSKSDFQDKTRSSRSRINSEPKTPTSTKSNCDETTKIDDSSDSESTSNKTASKLKNQRKSLRLQNSSEPETPEKKRADDTFEEFVTKKSPPKKSTIIQESTPSDSSDEEKIKTVSSKSRKRKNAEKNKKPDNLWLYLNRTLKKLQPVKKLHKKEKINLPNKKLDDKFYKQVPYVLLEKNETAQLVKSVNKRPQKTETVNKKAKTTKMVSKKVQRTKTVVKKFPKIKLRSPKRNSTDKENNRRSSTRINKSPVIITLSDDEPEDVERTSFVQLETLRCNICDKVSNTLWECKAHDLFHTKPEQVVINVVRENLKDLQKTYNLDQSKNINKILSKYLQISENSVSNLLVNLSNGHSSKGSVEGEDEKGDEAILEKDSTTTSTSCIPLSTEKSSSTSEDNSDCENIPSVINEKKRKLSILLNNSREKSDSSSPNPKRVRFALDDKASIPHSQLIEDLSKSKSKFGKDDVHNVTL